MPRKILLFAATTGYQTRVFAEAALRMGVEPVLATDHCPRLGDPWGDRAIPVKFHKPAASVETVMAAHGERGPFDGVAAVGDRPTVLAALAAERLGLAWHPVAAVEAARSKFLSRERFRAAGMRVPSYRRYALEAEPGEAAAEASYPCVLKPLGLSASRGVIRANNPGEFVAAFHRIRALLADPDIVRQRDQQNRFIQVESFIPGSEFALEGVVTAGRLRVFALFDKPDPLDGPFFEETIYVTPSRQPARVQDELVRAVEQAVAALGLRHGPVHAEMRWNDEGAWILEVAARPIGGLCAKALTFDGGIPLEEVILRHAMGEDVSGVRLDGPAAGVMMIPIPQAGVYRGVAGEDRAAAVPGITGVAVTAKEGQRMLPLPEGSSYLGFLFAHGDSADFVERALRGAHGALSFDIAPLLPVIRPAPAG